MNEGLNVFRQLAPEQIERRLRRCGIEADSDSIARGARRKRYKRHSCSYSFTWTRPRKLQTALPRAYFFNLAVLDCQPLGAGAAMGGVLGGWWGRSWMVGWE
ncbi:hypothetical protein ACFTAO_25705 [Paenibacillus rhizoplanae]